MFLRKPKICFAPEGADRGTPDDEGPQSDVPPQGTANGVGQDALVTASGTVVAGEAGTIDKPQTGQIGVVTVASGRLNDFLASCRDNAISQDTGAYNEIFHHVQGIHAALARIKE